MIEPYENLMTVRYLANLSRAQQLSPSGGVLRELARFLDGPGSCLGVSLAAASSDLDAQQDTLDRALERRLLELEGAPPSSVEQNLHSIASGLGLDAEDCALLGLLVRARLGSEFESVCHTFRICMPQPDAASFFLVVPQMLGLSRAEVAARLGGSGELASCGLVRVGRDGEIEVPDRVLRVVRTSAVSPSNLREQFLGRPLAGDLDWDDFDHVGADRGLVAAALYGASDDARKGIHVLLYGPAGTGKTEFCKFIAAEVGLPLYSVGESGESGFEPARSERMAAYLLAQRLLSRGPSALILLDEMEDVIVSRSAKSGQVPESRGSRVFLHRLLENAPVPTLWTTNDIDEVDPSILRRMTCAVEMRIPSAAVRTRVWRRAAEREKLVMSEEEVVGLARQHAIAPAVATGAVRSAAMAGGGLPEIRQVLAGLAKALNGGVAPRSRASPERPLSLSLYNSSIDLEELTEQLSKERAFSICLYGPAGTGKSAYALHLAERTGMEVLVKRTSDLVSKWVGDTEKMIAATFEEARSAGAILVFDEADSLLHDRRSALRSWEVSQVNEMLAQMSEHDLPFICATNLFDSLDEASLRRFTFKIRLDYLTPEQGALAFRQFFRHEPGPGLSKLATLTPGDFVVVARRAALLGAARDPDRLTAMLAEEGALKRHLCRPIGFRSPQPGPQLSHRYP